MRLLIAALITVRNEFYFGWHELVGIVEEYIYFFLRIVCRCFRRVVFRCWILWLPYWNEKISLGISYAIRIRYALLTVILIQYGFCFCFFMQLIIHRVFNWRSIVSTFCWYNTHVKICNIFKSFFTSKILDWWFFRFWSRRSVKIYM